MAKPLDSDAHLFAFFCECSNIDCTLSMPMSLAVYEEVRADPTTFVVAPGHELPEIEEVVRRTPDYQIVRKHGDARVSWLRTIREAERRRTRGYARRDMGIQPAWPKRPPT